MFDLHKTLKIHRKTVLVSGNGFSVNCWLKPDLSQKEFHVRGFSTFIGLTFDENGSGFFGDSFELTVNLDDVFENTKLLPARNWGVLVELPQLNYQKVLFAVEDAAIDRTIGIALLKCTATVKKGEGKRVDRTRSGGI